MAVARIFFYYANSQMPELNEAKKNRLGEDSGLNWAKSLTLTIS